MSDPMHDDDPRPLLAQLDEVDWKLHKAKHETPCCGQTVRVKLVEPGVQVRKCDICKATNHFVLEPMSLMPDRVKLRWMTEAEVSAYQDIDGPEIGDL